MQVKPTCAGKTHRTERIISSAGKTHCTERLIHSAGKKPIVRKEQFIQEVKKPIAQKDFIRLRGKTHCAERPYEKNPLHRRRKKTTTSSAGNPHSTKTNTSYQQDYFPHTQCRPRRTTVQTLIGQYRHLRETDIKIWRTCNLEQAPSSADMQSIINQQQVIFFFLSTDFLP